MDKIAILPFFVGIILLFSKSTKEVFLLFFIPILTIFPTYYETKLIQGIPEFNFYTSALLPILLFWIFRDKLEGYHFSLLDIWIYLIILTLFIAQLYNSDYKISQKFIFNEMMARLFPYLIMKSFFGDRKLRGEIIRIIIIIGAVVGFFNLYEFRFWDNVFDQFLRKIWPFYVPWDLPMKRGGFKRAFGPFGHPIIAGYFFALLVPIAVWYWRNYDFKKKWHGPLIVLLLIGGGIASISRAPIAAIFIGLVILWIGWSKRKLLVLGIVFAGIVVFATVYLPQIIEYVSVDRSLAETEDQRNAAYRKELIDNYMDIVEERPTLGWGRFGVPWVDSQVSIDNEYLFLALTHGKLNVFVYVASMLVAIMRLIWFIHKSKEATMETTIAWAFIAGILAAGFTQTTVWNGFQIVPYFYMYLAMSEAIVIYKSQNDTVNKVEFNIKRMEEKKHAYNFSRTL